MCCIPDNYDRFETHDAEMEVAMGVLPVCSICMEPIQDDYCYSIDDEIVCQRCLVEHYRHSTTDFMG